MQRRQLVCLVSCQLKAKNSAGSLVAAHKHGRQLKNLTAWEGSWISAVLLASSRVSALMVWKALLGSAASTPI